MTRWTFIRRSLRFHARAHLGVLLGAAIAGAVLTGALLVGDSVRQTLLDRALARLGPIEYALAIQDRLFLDNLAERIDHSKAYHPGSYAAALKLPGTVATQDGSARVNQATILGVDENHWALGAGWRQMVFQSNAVTFSSRIPNESLTRWRSGETVFVNHALAEQLKVRPGDEIIIRLRKPSALAQDAVISPRDDTAVALRLTVDFIVPPELLGDFSLVANQLPPANVFIALRELQRRLGVIQRSNLIVHRGSYKPRTLSWFDNLRVNLHRRVGSWPLLRRALAPLVPRTTQSVPPHEALQNLQEDLRRSWRLEDAQLSLKYVEPRPSLTGGEAIAPFVELSTERIFLEPQVVHAALTPRTILLTNHLGIGLRADDAASLALGGYVTNGVGVLTYLANLIRSGEHATPYSMVTAAGSPLTPSGMRDDEILVNEWLAQDLQLKPGDGIYLSYYVVDSASRLVERTNTFTVRAIVPIKGPHADRTLMPEFPGLAKAESTHDWDAGFPLVHEIRDKDEAYWKQYRGTPKAFVTLAAGQRMWANRFGNLTSIRYPLVPAIDYLSVVERNLLANLDPAELGLRFEPVREQALKAATQSQDFGQLFLGFSLFLIVSALLLMALLFGFALEQRAPEIGTLLALGFTPRQVRRFFLVEGAAIALLGGVLGALGGVAYAKAMLWALVTHWRSAVGTSVLQFHSSPATLLAGAGASTAVAVLTIWLALRKQARQPAAALLAGVAVGDRRPPNPRRRRLSARFSGAICFLVAAGSLAWATLKGGTDAGAFFGAGALLLLSGLASIYVWLGELALRTGVTQLTLRRLGVRAAGRRRTRSLATVALLASGAFVIASIGVFRLDSSRDAFSRPSGTGGFALVAESALPVLQDLNTASGREAWGLGEKDLAGVRTVSFRVRPGDDASCLNLNRAQRPRLLGVRPELLTNRFTFTKTAPGLDVRSGWQLLGTASARNLEPGAEEIPAIGDANSIQWALGKKPGDTIEYTDELGRAFKLRLVGAVANSILQGSLVIDEEQFTRKFPTESGYRFFLLDTPTNSLEQVSAKLGRALQDVGFELTPAVRRLDAFNAVQNTYLGTFQILGGLGLLLGSAGLGIVVLRNVWERRGELALLVAVGFPKRALQRVLLFEHGALLALGLGLGLVSAAVAVLPALLTPGTELPLQSLLLTLAAVLLNGALWTWLATRYALRGNLLEALRNE